MLGGRDDMRMMNEWMDGWMVSYGDAAFQSIFKVVER